MIYIKSPKGKDFNGVELSEDNVHARMLVEWRKKMYFTGNRRHQIIELFDADGKFIRCVSAKYICLVEPLPS